MGIILHGISGQDAHKHTSAHSAMEGDNPEKRKRLGDEDAGGMHDLKRSRVGKRNAAEPGQTKATVKEKRERHEKRPRDAWDEAADASSAAEERALP